MIKKQFKSYSGMAAVRAMLSNKDTRKEAEW